VYAEAAARQFDELEPAAVSELLIVRGETRHRPVQIDDKWTDPRRRFLGSGGARAQEQRDEQHRNEQLTRELRRRGEKRSQVV
jgi:hypothetical protein